MLKGNQLQSQRRNLQRATTDQASYHQNSIDCRCSWV